MMKIIDISTDSAYMFPFTHTHHCVWYRSSARLKHTMTIATALSEIVGGGVTFISTRLGTNLYHNIYYYH